MRICFIAKDLDMKRENGGYGGHRRFVYELVTRIQAERNTDVWILAEKISGFSDKIKRVEGVSLNGNFFWNYLKLRSFLKECNLIHAIDGWPSGVLGYLLRLGSNKKLIITAEGTNAVKPLYDWPRSWLLKKAYRATDLIIAVSRFTASEIEKAVSGVRINVINHGVDLRKFSSQHSCKPEILGEFRRFIPYVLSVGDIRMRKGYHVSLAAFKKVIQSVPELNYVIVGFKQDNDYTESVREYVKNNNLSERVHFLEDIPDDFLQEIYHHAELFILLPVNIEHDFEGFGLVFLEAAASGLPAITTNGNGSADSVLDGQTGLVVPQENSLLAAAAITKLLTNQELRKTMSENASEFVNKMNWEGVAEQYLEIYSSYSQNRNLTAYNHPAAVKAHLKESLYEPEKIIFDKFFIPQGRTLDIGCGTGRTTINLHRRGFEVVGIDFAESMIKQARQNYPDLNFALMDATKLQFDNDTFNNILFSFNGLDYLYPKSNRLVALEEIYRALKPGGIFAFSSHNSRFIPNSPGRIKNWLLNAHRSFLGSDYFIDHQEHGDLFTFRANLGSQIVDLNKVGFKVIKILSRYTSRNWLVQFRDPWPYYVCKK